MRIVWRWIAFALVLVPVIAAGGSAQPEPRLPPAPAPVPIPVAPLNEEEARRAERAKLQEDLLTLLKTLKARGSAPMTPPTPPKAKTDYPPSEIGKSIDQVREGMNLFRDGYFDAARRTFLTIDPNTLNREDRVFARYMLACSLRRLNKPSSIAEAEAVYREVANNTDDEFYAKCAVSQLGLIHTNQDLEAQLEQLRSRAKSK